MSEFVCDVCGHETKSKSNLTKHKSVVHDGERKFECLVCNKFFATKFKLNLHNAVHSDSRPYLCFCSKAFKTRDDLMKHSRIHNKGPFNCFHCPVIFHDKKLFDTHLKSIDSNENLISNKNLLCNYCNKSFSDSYCLKRHIKTIHEKSAAQFVCGCGKVYTQSSDLKRHQARHHADRNANFQCGICPKIFKYEGDLKDHLKNLHLKNFIEEKFKCLKCDSYFYGRSNLEQHFVENHPEAFVEDLNEEIQSKNFKCDICLKKFSRYSNLNQHRKVHFKTTLICDFCSKEFSWKQSLRTHFQTCRNRIEFCEKKNGKLNNVQAKDVEILDCDNFIDISRTKEEEEKDFTNESIQLEGTAREEKNSKPPNKFNFEEKLFEHEFTKTENEDAANATIKEGKFVEKINSFVSSHTFYFLFFPDSATNAAKLKYYCDLCHSYLSNRINFQRHMYHDHSNAKLFHCKSCNERFFNNHNLTIHQNSNRHQHNLQNRSKQRYQCDFCSKFFRNKSVLTIHMRAHSNECHFFCKECQRGFKYATSFKIHQRAHNKEILGLECEICEKKFVTKQSLTLHKNNNHTENNNLFEMKEIYGNCLNTVTHNISLTCP